ncbi:hypothetical protein ACHAXA_007593 [Cyclostephanos tholiformis]|uniref:Uncharacterized protein n=1 Tax=Cyclostephanos tholiformis TaxID=382380 RepID=A0ABD3RF18_9STRA
MFSEVRSRLQPLLQRADTELRFRLKVGEPGTASDVHELEATAGALRKRYRQIVGEENASYSEACTLAADAMQWLRDELDGRRYERDGLRAILDEIKDEFDRVENEYTREGELRESCRCDVVRMKHDTEKAREEIINLRFEMKQKTYFQETVDSETKHRLKADLQNLETERERSAINLRQLKKERDKLKYNLVQLQAEKDAVQLALYKRKQELSEINMTKDMYRAHQEALLETLSCDRTSIYQAVMPEKISHLFKGWYNWQRIRELDKMKEGSKKTASENRDPTRIICDREKQDVTSIENKFIGEVSKSPFEGKGLVLGADTDGSSNFLRKLPTIFKLGGGIDDYVPKHILERRISTSSQVSWLDISDLTVDK